MVTIELEDAHHVCVENVVSYRLAKDQPVVVPGLGRFLGDIAWGGNWFFFVREHQEELKLANVERLTEVTWRIRQALTAQGITGANGALIDHIELFGPPTVPGAQSKNFVLCPGKAYDRSPCGTGTSAKLACLVADGKLAEGEVYRQESILGSVFEGSVRIVEGRVHPRVRGSAYVTAETTLLLDPDDPFQMGIRP
jgi:4-hydroxyproline epimerase